MAYLDYLDALAEGTADKVQRVVQAHDRAEIDRAEAVALIGAIIATANARAAALADLALSADLTIRTGQAIPTLGIGTPPGDVARLNRAAATLLDALPDTPDPEARARRLGRSEPLTTAGKARGQAIAQQPTVEGWTRQFNSPKPCELCVWWSRDGRVWPKTHTIAQHKGCTCTQNPVLVESVRRVQR